MRAKKMWSMVAMLAMVTTLAAGCGEKETTTTTPTATTAPTTTTAPTATAEPTATAAPTATAKPEPTSAVKPVTVSADCVVDFENEAMGFVQLDQYPLLADAEAVVEVVDLNGSKALKMTPSNGKKEMIVGLDVSSLLGDRVAELKSVTMDMYLGREDGEFYACSGVIYAYTGEGAAKKTDASWSVYLEKANPRTVERVFDENEVFVAGQNNIIAISKIVDNGFTKVGTTASLYVDNLVFWDANGNALPVDTSVSFNGPEGFGAAEAGANGFTDKAIDIYATLDSASANTYQISWKDATATGATKAKSILFEIAGDFSSAGWIGGGGALGFNYGEDGWYQVDFEITEDARMYEIEIPSDIAAQIDFEKEGAIIQVGFWWGSVSTCTLTRLEVKDGSAPSAWTENAFDVYATLDSASTNVYQLPWADVAAKGVTAPKQIIAELVGEFEAAGWIGGGGSIGFNYGADGWYQVDFEITGDSNLVVVEIPSDIAEQIDMSVEDAIVQVGFWWGSAPTCTLTKVDFR